MLSDVIYERPLTCRVWGTAIFCAESAQKVLAADCNSCCSSSYSLRCPPKTRCLDMPNGRVDQSQHLLLHWKFNFILRVSENRTTISVQSFEIGMSEIGIMPKSGQKFCPIFGKKLIIFEFFCIKRSCLVYILALFLVVKPNFSQTSIIKTSSDFGRLLFY